MADNQIRTNFCAQCKERADRIEALEAENERLRGAIKVQASAVRALQANEATEINILRQQKRDWHHAVSTLDSEREANAILTAENERLREVLLAYTEYCGICHGRGSIIEEDAVTGADLWRDCPGCGSARAALEPKP